MKSIRHNPADSLADIIENADRLAAYLDGVDYARFQADSLVRDASERCLERICEAAFRLRDRAEQLLPEQPWQDIRGMGNRLRHGYDKLNLKTVWNAMTIWVPPLRDAAARVLAELEPNGPA